jgi:hypothetical protein
MTLESGDVIAIGTLSGVGFARKPSRLLCPGDVVKVEIEGEGLETLENPVVAEVRAVLEKEALTSFDNSRSSTSTRRASFTLPAL